MISENTNNKKYVYPSCEFDAAILKLEKQEHVPTNDIVSLYQFISKKVFKKIAIKYNVGFYSDYSTMIELLENSLEIEKLTMEKLIDFYKEYEEVVYGGNICNLDTLRLFKEKASFLASPKHQKKVKSENNSKVLYLFRCIFLSILKYLTILILAELKPHMIKETTYVFVTIGIFNIGWIIWFVIFAFVVFMLVRKQAHYIIFLALLKPDTYTMYLGFAGKAISLIWIMWFVFFSLYVIVCAFESVEKLTEN